MPGKVTRVSVLVRPNRAESGRAALASRAGKAEAAVKRYAGDSFFFRDVSGPATCCGMPLILYLDTQDYINLFNEPDDGPNHCVLAELLSLRDRGEIVIGFSFATIMEFITKPDVTNRPERVRRGQLIKDICGPNAFPYPSDIPKGASFPNDGIWMTHAKDKLITARDFREKMRAMFLEDLAKIDGLNRQERRFLARRTSLAELARRLDSTWGRNRSDWGDIPVSDEIIQSRIFERFIKGHCSDHEFESQMNSWFFDPAEYSRIVYDYADKPNLIVEFFCKSIDDIERAAKGIQEMAEKVRGMNAEIMKIRSRLIEVGIEKSEARKLTKQFPIPEPSTLDPNLETILGKGRVGHFKHYMSRISKPGYTFKRSDVMDLFQLCYAYDCDLFRCDKAMANIFRDYEPFQGKLVASFRELPDRVAGLVDLFERC